MKNLFCSILLALAATVHAVQFSESTHRLYFVDSPDDIDYDAVGIEAEQFEDVPAYTLENNQGVRIQAMARGATMVELSVAADDDDDMNRTQYLWENIEGATYYGPETNNFPLKRGLIIHGGVRFAAVTSEHGLYYDTDWDMTLQNNNNTDGSMSIAISITDDAETRERVRHFVPPLGTTQNITGFSSGQFNNANQNEEDDEMTKYPVTNLTYTFTITLKDDEDFVRLKMSVTNPSTTATPWAEAWLPMTFPIHEQSQILSRQRMRWRKDSWCMDDTTPNMIEWKEYEYLNYPLQWPMGCIFYDIPYMTDSFHGVTMDEGKGVVYYVPNDNSHSPYYTKLWSWGQDPWGQGAPGRPASSYYEPWNSGTNMAFFQTRAFPANTTVSWELAILPISEGLDDGQDYEELLHVVDQHLEERMEQLSSLGPIMGLDNGRSGTSSNEQAEELPEDDSSSANFGWRISVLFFVGLVPVLLVI